ncbi:MAG: M24 family metallopeptidase [Pseudomonadota bacterium]
MTLFDTNPYPGLHARPVFSVLGLGALLLVLLSTPQFAVAQGSQDPAARPYVIPMQTSFVPEERVLTHREQAGLVRGWLEKRFETVLPKIMRREGIDMWIIISREYNDDPVFRSLSPFETYSSRRRTILVFHDRGEELGVEALSVGRFNYQGLYTVVPTHNEEQFEGLRALVEERNPRRIGVNMSERWNHADGLTAVQRDALFAALDGYTNRIVSAEMLVVGWLETRLPEETDAYRHIMRVAHSIIGRAFSNEVIVPGVTTANDVRWWMRQQVAEYGLEGWFHPSIGIQRRGRDGRFSGDEVIQRGDMLWTDFGIHYLGFATDTQHNAYVLRPEEVAPPEGLQAGLRKAMRMQDITRSESRPGRTGNAALAASLAQADEEELDATVYWHSIGYHGHAAGVPLGMTDYQEGVPIRGEYTFQPSTWHSVELNVVAPVPEWDGQEVKFSMEEDALLTEEGWEWILGRQESFYLIR